MEIFAAHAQTWRMMLSNQLPMPSQFRSMLRACLPVLVMITNFSGAEAVPSVSIAGGDNNAPLPQSFVSARPTWSVFANVHSGFLERSISTAIIAPPASFRYPSQTQQRRSEPAPTTGYISRRGNNLDGRSWDTAWVDMNQINWSVVVVERCHHARWPNDRLRLSYGR